MKQWCPLYGGDSIGVSLNEREIFLKKKRHYWDKVKKKKKYTYLHAENQLKSNRFSLDSKL